MSPEVMYIKLIIYLHHSVIYPIFIHTYIILNILNNNTLITGIFINFNPLSKFQIIEKPIFLFF